MGKGQDGVIMREVTCMHCDNTFYLEMLDFGNEILPANFCAFCGIEFNVITEDSSV